MADDPNDFFDANPGMARVLADLLPRPAASLPPAIAALQELHERAVRIQAEGEALGEPADWDQARAQALELGRDDARLAAFTEGLGVLDVTKTERKIPPDDEGGA